MGRTVEVTRAQRRLIVIDHRLDTVDAGVEDIAVEGEAVRRTIVEGWNRSAEAVQVDHLVAVVELQDVADAANRLKILIPARIEEVERPGRSWVTVGEGEVYSHGEVDLATTEHILKEGVLCFDLELIKVESAGLLGYLMLGGTLFEHSQRECNGTQVLMFAIRDRLEEFKFYFPLDLVPAQVARTDLHLVETMATGLSSFNLTLVDRGVLADGNVAVDDEEA